MSFPVMFCLALILGFLGALVLLRLLPAADSSLTFEGDGEAVDLQLLPHTQETRLAAR